MPISNVNDGGISILQLSQLRDHYSRPYCFIFTFYLVLSAFWRINVHYIERRVDWRCSFIRTADRNKTNHFHSWNGHQTAVSLSHRCITLLINTLDKCRTLQISFVNHALHLMIFIRSAFSTVPSETQVSEVCYTITRVFFQCNLRHLYMILIIKSHRLIGNSMPKM